MTDYEGELKSTLLKICVERGVNCPQRLKKSDIIALLEGDDKKKASQRSSGKKPAAKKKKPSPVKKISIISAIPVVQSYLAMGRRGDNVVSILERYLHNYDWTAAEKVKKEVEAMIANPPTPKKEIPEPRKAGGRGKARTDLVDIVPEPLIVPPPSRRVATGPKYVPGKYKPLEILSVQFGKKEDSPPKEAKKRERISITLTELRKEVDNPTFIKAFTKSSKDLMTAKVIFYTRRLEEAKKEYNALQEKVRKLKLGGVAERTIEDMYPGYPTMGAFIIDLQSLIELVKRRGDSVTEKEIKEGLMEAIDDGDEGIASLIGRDEVKNQIASQLYSFSKGYKTFIGSFNNIAIYGPAGVGKTALAKVIAFAFSRVGILAKDTVKIATRNELVGQYIGQTAPKTRSVLVETLEGVLFVDEAYQLTACPEEKIGSKDFGSEAITEIVNFLDKYVGMSIVIVAGYEGVMSRCFMAFNEGLPRRFPYRYILSPYSDAELTDILVSNLRRKIPEDIKIDDETANFLYSMITKIRVEISDALRNQAGDMLNLSAQLNKAITSSFKIKWKNGDLGHNIPIILSGFDDFLSTKGYSVYG